MAFDAVALGLGESSPEAAAAATTEVLLDCARLAAAYCGICIDTCMCMFVSMGMGMRICIGMCICMCGGMRICMCMR